ncbi:hypothetical protein BDR03DRAFT_943359 [Suillus americanus]|nr:hypothetical protein BDR03DRAFT_943359 [Suillus americanus]
MHPDIVYFILCFFHCLLSVGAVPWHSADTSCPTISTWRWEVHKVMIVLHILDDTGVSSLTRKKEIAVAP